MASGCMVLPDYYSDFRTSTTLTLRIRTHSNVGSLLPLATTKISPIRGLFNGGWGGIARDNIPRPTLISDCPYGHLLR